MSRSDDRIILDGCNLGSLAGLRNLTTAIEAINSDLAQARQRWSLAELLEFRRTLDALNALLIKLRRAAYQRTAALAEEYIGAI